MDTLHLVGVVLLIAAVTPVAFYVWNLVGRWKKGPSAIQPISTEAPAIEVLKEVTDEEFEERAQAILNAVQSPKPASELDKQGRSRDR